MPGIADTTNVNDSSSSSGESLPATPENTPSEAATPVMTNREITQTDKINKRLLESLLNRMSQATTNGTNATTTEAPGGTRSLSAMLQMGRGSDDEDDVSDEWH